MEYLLCGHASWVSPLWQRGHSSKEIAYYHWSHKEQMLPLPLAELGLNSNLNQILLATVKEIDIICGISSH